MSVNDHLVSIIIPVFDRINLIKQTLKSIKNQTYSNWEILLIDDGSTDGTIEYLEELIKEDPRVVFYKRNLQPKGASTCRNIGMDLAKGEYIVFLDSDDLLFRDSLEKRIFHFNLNPSFDFLVFPALIFTNTPGDSDILWNIDKEEDDISRFLDLDVPWQTTAPIWRRTSIADKLFWDHETSAWEDMDFHINAITRGLKYKKVKGGPDYYYRVANVDKLSKNDKTINQLYSRIKLIENIVDYFSLNKKYNKLYKKKIFKFYMWICISFVRAQHKKGVELVCHSLHKKGIYNWLDYKSTKVALTIFYHCYQTTFRNRILTSIRSRIKNFLFKIYFQELPPKNSTVKVIKYEPN